jgi:hypothetical protein
VRAGGVNGFPHPCNRLSRNAKEFTTKTRHGQTPVLSAHKKNAAHLRSVSSH